jgi:hypothetical protein
MSSFATFWHTMLLVLCQQELMKCMQMMLGLLPPPLPVF